MQSPGGKKVVVAMSGGVDSSVAAALLHDEGYEVVGCFMRLGHEELTQSGSCKTPAINHHHGCCSANDAADARAVAARLGIPFYVLNFERDFDRIINYFVSEYNEGRTPNPCVRCNDWLKFGKLAAYARSIDAQYIATGHYARVDRSGGEARLLRGLDQKKDQSYVLFGLDRAMLEMMLLPVGEYEKPEVRRLAAEHNLPVHDKPDSQEICFVPDGDYSRVVRQLTPERMRPGEVLDTEGNVLGKHEGQQAFTIGQRRGIGVALGRPIYVVDKDPVANTVTIADKERLLARGLIADQANWFVDLPHDQPHRCQVKIRYNGSPVPATVRITGPKNFEVRFEESQAAVSPGQAAVCYDDQRVLGGGWIQRAVK